jgi:hypothetical protein
MKDCCCLMKRHTLIASRRPIAQIWRNSILVPTGVVRHARYKTAAKTSTTSSSEASSSPRNENKSRTWSESRQGYRDTTLVLSSPCEVARNFRPTVVASPDSSSQARAIIHPERQTRAVPVVRAEPVSNGVPGDRNYITVDELVGMLNERLRGRNVVWIAEESAPNYRSRLPDAH